MAVARMQRIAILGRIFLDSSSLHPRASPSDPEGVTRPLRITTAGNTETPGATKPAFHGVEASGTYGWQGRMYCSFPLLPEISQHGIYIGNVHCSGRTKLPL